MTHWCSVYTNSFLNKPVRSEVHSTFAISYLFVDSRADMAKRVFNWALCIAEVLGTCGQEKKDMIHSFKCIMQSLMHPITRNIACPLTQMFLFPPKRYPVHDWFGLNPLVLYIV